MQDNKKTGSVLWYDRRDGNGIIVDTEGHEYYTDSSVLVDLNYLDPKDQVTFTADVKGGTPCAYDVALTSDSFEEGKCVWCWEQGKDAEATTDNGELCDDCEFSRQLSAADAMHDSMKENG